MFADYHVHSYYSADSNHKLEDLIKDAIDISLDEICITDHVDYGTKDDWDIIESKRGRNVDYEKFFNEIYTLKEKYKDQISVKVGMEFGIQMHTIDNFKALYDKYDFDFILMSVHQINNKQFWNNEFQVNKSESECYQAYYEELLNLVKSYKDYSVLAHFDLMRRYVPSGLDTFNEFKEIISEILKVVIADGKRIEINLSNDRYKVDGLTPSFEILKLYHELGGTIITIGTDSHKKEHLGQNIKGAARILKGIGFQHITTFDKMIPIYHNINDCI